MADEFDGLNDERLEQAAAIAEGVFNELSEVGTLTESSQKESDASHGGINLASKDSRIWNQIDGGNYDGEATTSSANQDAYIWNQEVGAGSTDRDTYIWNEKVRGDTTATETAEEAEDETSFEWVDEASITTAGATTASAAGSSTPDSAAPPRTDTLNTPDPSDERTGDHERDTKEMESDRDSTSDKPSERNNTDTTSRSGSNTTTSSSELISDRNEEEVWDTATRLLQRVDDLKPASNQESHTDVVTDTSDSEDRLWNVWADSKDSSLKTLLENSSESVETTASRPSDESTAKSAETLTEAADTPTVTQETTPHSKGGESDTLPTVQQNTPVEKAASEANLEELLTPRGTQVLLEGSMDDPATQAACDQLLDPDYPHHTFIIAPEDHATKRVQQVHASGEGETTVVALMTQSPTEAAQSRTIRTDTADPVTIERVNAYTDFSRIGILISQALADLDGSLPTVACFHGIETLVQSVDAEPLFKFLHIITNELSMADVTAHYQIDRDRHPQTVSTIEPLFEQSVTVSADGYDIETQSGSSQN